MRAPLASLCFVAFVVAAPASVRAQHASGSTLRRITAELDYQLRDGAQGRCPPDPTPLRRRVAARLGFDAFEPDAAGLPVGRVRVTVTRTPQGFAAQLDYEDTAGKLWLTRHAGMMIGKTPVRTKPFLQAKQMLPASTVHLIANVAVLTADKVGRLFFNWQSTLDGGKTWVNEPPSPHGNTYLANLTPLQTYGFRVSVNDARGPGEWTMMVTLLIH